MIKWSEMDKDIKKFVADFETDVRLDVLEDAAKICRSSVNQFHAEKRIRAEIDRILKEANNG